MTLPQYGSPNFLQSTFAVIPRIPRQHATKDSQGSTPTRIYLRFRQRQEATAKQVGPFGGPQMAVLFEISHSDPFHTLDLHDP